MNRSRLGFHRAQLGFTLIEIMIVVAIAAILAAVALPSYNEYIRRSHRANARATVLELSQWFERVATAQGVYPGAAAIPAGMLQVEGGRYTVAVDPLTPAAFTITATPVGAQSGDKCGAFTLTNTGLRGAAGSTAGALVRECWNR